MVLNKIVFCLANLVVLLALCCVTPAMAQFEIKLSIAANQDVSFADGNQVQYGVPILIKIMSTKVVNVGDSNPADYQTPITPTTIATTGLEALDFTIIAYNKFGGTFPTYAPALDSVVVDGTADGKHFMANLGGVAVDSGITRILLVLKKNSVELADPRAELDDDGERKAEGKNAEASITFHYVEPEPTTNDLAGYPGVYSIRRADDPLLPVTAETVNVIILLSEKPKEFKKGNVDVTNATWGDPVALVAIPDDDNGLDNDADSVVDNMPSTGRDDKLYPYVLTITPKYENKDDIVVKVKMFEDMVLPRSNKYYVIAPGITAREADYVEGRSKLTIKVGKETPAAKAAGFKVPIVKDKVIPGSGYLVLTEETAGSSVHPPPGAIDASPKAHERTPTERLYNVVDVDFPNLETFLANGGVIDVMSPHPLVISEVMWGSDASLDDGSKSQWIELYNTGAEFKTAGDADAETAYFVFYGPNETPPAMTPAVTATATTPAVPATLPAGVTDRIGTIDALGAYWSLAGKGQSGRTGAGEEAADLTAIIPTQPIISMYRMMDATGKVADGTLAASWIQSTPPNLNFDRNQSGNRIGTPGASRLITAAAAAATAAAAKAKAEAAAAAAAKAADTSVSMPKVGQIYISEVMFAGGGTLPQWIEISNGSRSEQVNLSGWTLTVENATADADVSVGSKAVFTIPEGTKVDPSSQSDTPSTILVVTEQGRHNLDAGPGTMGEDQILNLWTAQQTELILLGVTKRRYSLLSDMAFQITLAPPVPIVAPAAKTKAPTTAAGIAAARTAAAAKAAADATAAKERADATDVAGNLGPAGTATWALPMDEGARSSIIRRHVPVSIGPAAPEAGEMMDSWALASDTSFAQVTHIRASSYYGSADDVGTPGFRAGGALPVELSHFRPARNKDTGAVVITWSTQSELNNAGFFIKRSQQRDGEFQIINATMIPGAGTSSEKQFYTYEDTTAQPNVVYYYQIEDVSLDGNRQTLTNSIRLKGHVGAAGKATTTWGDLKTQE